MDTLHPGQPGVSSARNPKDSETPTSGVAWAAIIGGAFVAAAVSLILVALGAGLGLSAASPWPGVGATATTFAVTTAIWLVIVHWLASGFGGYLTGRLRAKSVGLHTHEVFFRDTAHGLLTWATATVVAVALLGSGAAALVAAGAKATASGATQDAARGSSPADPMSYFVDKLYRSNQAAAVDQDTRQETSRILAAGLGTGDVPPADRAYLSQLVASKTGLSQTEAQQRVNDVLAQAKDAETKARQKADTARKAGAYLSLFTALAMAIGAFIAAVAGALGGSHRDEWSARLATLPR
jgi:hypothetical protein